MPINVDTSARKAKIERDLRKVQQRVIAILIFALAYQCVFALIVVAEIVQNQGRDGDAYGLVVMAGVVAVLMTGAIRVVLKYSFISLLWTPLAVAPPIAAAIWLL